MATLAVLCGAGRGTEVELIGRQKQAWPTTFLALPYGIPLHDTFGRVFERLDPAPLEVCLVRWVRSLSEALRRRTRSRSYTPVASHTACVVPARPLCCSKRRMPGPRFAKRCTGSAPMTTSHRALDTAISVTAMFRLPCVPCRYPGPPHLWMRA